MSTKSNSRASLSDPRSWLTDFLAEACAGATIVHLGVHDALSPDNELCQRNLFAAVRSGPAKS